MTTRNAAALIAAVAVSVLVTAPADAASTKRCGRPGVGPDHYDLRVRGESCSMGRSVARAWVREMSNVFDEVEVRGHACRGKRSSRRIRSTATFVITCERGRRVARWWIVPTH